MTRTARQDRYSENCYRVSMNTGDIDGYQFAVIDATKLIAVRRPDGSLCMLPGAVDVENAVKTFIRADRAAGDRQNTPPENLKKRP